MSIERMKKAIDAALAAYEAWLADESVNEVTEPLEDAVESLVLIFEAVEAPQQYQAVARVVERIAPEWTAWKMEVARKGAEGIFPSRRWTEAMRDLARHWILSDKPCLPPLEPVVELNRQKVSARQIAMIYGWLLDNGQPDTSKVFEELAEPGKHTSGIDHRIAKKQADREAKLAELDAIAERRIRARQKAEEAAPEGLDELIAQHVSRKQIRSMVPGVTDEQINESATRQGIEAPAEDYRSANATRGKYDKELSVADEAMLAAGIHGGREQEVTEETPAEWPQAVVEAVIAHSNAGLSPREVAKLIGGEIRTPDVRQILEQLTGVG